MTRPQPLLGVLVAALLSAAPAFAQAVFTATISGTVRDASDAVLPGVTVTAVHTDTGLVRTVVSDESGGYVVTNLPVGLVPVLKTRGVIRDQGSGIRDQGGEPFEDRAEPPSGVVERLSEHARLADRRHEIRVAVPARHQMDVHMFDDARAGIAPEVHADIDAVQPVRLPQRQFRTLCQTSHLVHLVGAQAGER